MPKGDKLTLKQKKWIKIYLETGNATEAARQAYDCKDDDSARAIGGENLAKLSMPITVLMDNMGLSEARLMKVLEDGLTAQKTELAKFQGEIGEEKDYDDLPTRKAYLELALKVRGLLRDRLSLEDPHGNPLGPVILPVKECDAKPGPDSAD